MRIKELREARGMNQAELARAVGASRPTVCQWESGARRPGLDFLPVLADVLGCSIDALYGRGAAAEPSIAGEEGKRHAG